MLNLWVFFSTFCCLMASRVVFADVVLRGNDGVTLFFADVPAKFARPVDDFGELGTLFLASPLDACSPLTNSSIEDGINSPYVLIIRGGCSFKDKVRRAQDAGFKAAIVYNSDESMLIAMTGDPSGIHIPAVFVSNTVGCKLRDYVGKTGIEVWLIQNDEEPIWAMWPFITASIVLLVVLLISIVLFLLGQRDHTRRERPRGRGLNGMSRRLVKAMPSLFYTTALEDNCTSTLCAICLEDYYVGDKLRILPCHHKFHTLCVDAWLTSWRSFCPVCKRDANTITDDPPATERTPLLSSSSSLLSSSSARSSSYVASRPMQIGQLSPSASNTSPLNNQQSLANPLIIPSTLPLSSMYIPFYASPGNVSTRSFTHQSCCSPCHSESVASFSRTESTRSLPEC